MDDSSETERLIPKNEEDDNNKKDNEVSTDNHKGLTCRRLCIVPVMILYFYTMGIIFFAVPEYIQSRVKEDIESEKHKTPLTGNTSHGGSDIDISPCEQNTSSPEYKIHTETQQQSAKWLMYIGLAGSIPALVSNLVFGSYSDVLGRRFVFGISTLGFTIRCIAVTLVVHFKANLLYIILGTLVDSASGSATVFFAVQFSYISDITHADNRRSVAIVLCELILGVTVSVSSLVTGYFIKYAGFFYPMLTATILCALAFILSVTIIPETLHHRNRSENKSCLRNVIRSVKLYTSPGTQRKRCKYLLLIISFTFMAIPSLNRMSLEALYQLGRPFCWDASKIGWFGTVKISCMSFIGLGSVFLLHRCLKDDSIAIIGNISGITSFVVEGLAKTDLVLYTVPVISALSFLPVPMIRSLMANITAEKDQGALFASIGSVETLCSLLGTLTNNIVYAATLTIMNGFVFLVCAGCNFFAVIFLLIYKWINRKEETYVLVGEIEYNDPRVTDEMGSKESMASFPS